MKVNMLKREPAAGLTAFALLLAAAALQGSPGPYRKKEKADAE